MRQNRISNVDGLGRVYCGVNRFDVAQVLPSISDGLSYLRTFLLYIFIGKIFRSCAVINDNSIINDF